MSGQSSDALFRQAVILCEKLEKLRLLELNLKWTPGNIDDVVEVLVRGIARMDRHDDGRIDFDVRATGAARMINQLSAIEALGDLAQRAQDPRTG